MQEVLVREGINPGKVSVLSMGVDLKEAFTPQPEVYRSPERLIFVGRLVEKKGLAYLLEAYARLKAEFPRLELQIVGDGPERNALHALATALGFDPAAMFVGSRSPDQLPRLYSSAAIAVVPSVVDRLGDQEGLGLVTIEAMGCGCAVVASDLPAIRDVVTHAHNGLLARAADSDALATQLRMLLTDPALRAKLARQARLDVCERFDWTSISARYATLYAALTPAGAGAGAC